MHIEIEKIKSLSFTSQLAFAYLACERFFPSYINFSQQFLFGDTNKLRYAIDLIRKNILDKPTTQDIIQRVYDEVNINTPDTEDYVDSSASYALDACCIVLNTLQLISDKKFEHIIHISRYGTDAVDRYILSNNKTDCLNAALEESILNHPIMKEEILIQNTVISFLSSKSSLDESSLDYILSKTPRIKT